MMPIDNLKEILEKINDPAAALRIIRVHGGLRLNNQDIQANLFRFGPIGFYLNTDQSLVSHCGKQKLRVPQPRPIANDKNDVFDKLDAGDVRVTIGPNALYVFDATVTSCDLLTLLAWSGIDELRRFVNEAFEKIFKTKVTRPFDERLGAGMLFVSRTCLDQESVVAQQTYVFFLREALVHLNLQSIIDEARAQGHDPLSRTEGSDRAREYDAAQAVIEYAFKFLLESPYCGADGLRETLGQMLLFEHEFLLNHLETLCLVASYTRLHCGQEAANRFAGAFAKDILKRWLAVPNSGYWAPMIESLARQCNLWHAIPSEAFEEALIEVTANGDFAHTFAFLKVTRWSAFLPGRHQDDAEPNPKILEEKQRVRQYLYSLLPRIYERAISLGRLDVAGAIVKRYKSALSLDTQYQCDLLNLAHAACPSAVIYGGLTEEHRLSQFKDLDKGREEEFPSDPAT